MRRKFVETGRNASDKQFCFQEDAISSAEMVDVVFAEMELAPGVVAFGFIALA
jgi:hypothetical protein